ncbi:hypothetical protein B0H11DRAFT_1902389 [Mycena galericulata]|nr:hypothetical protein B0H11DRAFT_1902389 [Mycena galericulata]
MDDEPGLDVYVNKYTKDAKTVRDLERRQPGGEDSTLFLSRFSDAKLFRIGLHSPIHWDVVTRFLHARSTRRIGETTVVRWGVDEPVQTEDGLPWPEVPKELQSEMLANFDLESLTSTAATCTELHTTSNHIIEGHLTRCFSLWDLNWLSIRFMLVQTESLVAGLWAHHLLFPNRVCRLKKTDILEFFVRSQAERGVIRYFEAASSWEQVKSDPPASVMKFLEGAVLLQHKDRNRFPQYIALHISGDIPGLAIYRQPLTSMFVSMSGNGIQVPYADLTFGNLSMVNHEFGGELSTSEGKNDMHNLFRRANEAGITIVAYHSTSDGKGYRSGWGNGTDTWLDEDYIDSLDSIIRAQ